MLIEIDSAYCYSLGYTDLTYYDTEKEDIVDIDLGVFWNWVINYQK